MTERVDKEIQLETLRQQGGVSGSSHPVSVSLDTTKPVPYKDGEDITAYIVRFERIASMIGLEYGFMSSQTWFIVTRKGFRCVFISRCIGYIRL